MSMSDNTVVPEGERPGEVTVQMMDLNSAIGKADNLVTRLRVALQPIINTTRGQTGEVAGAPLEELCPHADTLRGFNIRIRTFILALEDLLEYQEL